MTGNRDRLSETGALVRVQNDRRAGWFVVTALNAVSAVIGLLWPLRKREQARRDV
jgi:hypothetical protein